MKPVNSVNIARVCTAIGTAMLLSATLAVAQPLPAGKPAGTSRAALKTNEIYVLAAPILFGPLIWWAIFGGGNADKSTSSSKK